MTKATEAELLKIFKKIDRRFKKMDQRFERVDQRFEQMDQKFEQKFEQAEKRFDFLEQQFANMFLEFRLNMVTKGEFEEFKSTNASQHDLTMSGLNRLSDEFVILKDKLLDHDDRIGFLESRVGA